MAIDIASALRAYAAAPRPVQGQDETPGAAGGFGDMLAQTLGDAVAAQKAGESAMTATATGKAELVDMVTAIANAETTLETMVAMRDRVITAYQEIMRMPI